MTDGQNDSYDLNKYYSKLSMFRLKVIKNTVPWDSSRYLCSLFTVLCNLRKTFVAEFRDGRTKYCFWLLDMVSILYKLSEICFKIPFLVHVLSIKVHILFITRKWDRKLCRKLSIRHVIYQTSPEKCLAGEKLVIKNATLNVFKVNLGIIGHILIGF